MEVDDASKDQISQDRIHLNKATGSSEKVISVIQILRKEIQDTKLEIEELTLKNEYLTKCLLEKQKQSETMDQRLKVPCMKSLQTKTNNERLDLKAEIAKNEKSIKAKRTEVETKTQEIERRNKDIVDLQMTIKDMELRHKALIQEKNEELEKLKIDLCESHQTIKELLEQQEKLRNKIIYYEAELTKLKAQGPDS